MQLGDRYAFSPVALRTTTPPEGQRRQTPQWQTESCLPPLWPIALQQRNGRPRLHSKLRCAHADLLKIWSWGFLGWPCCKLPSTVNRQDYCLTQPPAVRATDLGSLGGVVARGIAPLPGSAVTEALLIWLPVGDWSGGRLLRVKRFGRLFKRGLAASASPLRFSENCSRAATVRPPRTQVSGTTQLSPVIRENKTPEKPDYGRLWPMRAKMAGSEKYFSGLFGKIIK